MFVCKCKRRVDVCPGWGVAVKKKKRSPSTAFAVAKVKPSRSKKTILESCYVSKPHWDRNQEVIRKETEYHTKLILSFERGHISCAVPPFNRRHSLIQTNTWFMKEFQISTIGTSPICSYPV